MCLNTIIVTFIYGVSLGRFIATRNRPKLVSPFCRHRFNPTSFVAPEPSQKQRSFSVERLFNSCILRRSAVNVYLWGFFRHRPDNDGRDEYLFSSRTFVSYNTAILLLVCMFGNFGISKFSLL